MVVVNQKSKITGACRFFNFNNCPLFNQITIECDFTLSLCLCVWLNLSFLDTYFSLTLSTSTHSLSPLTLAFTHKHFLFPSLSFSHALFLSLSHSFLAIIICHLEAFLRRRISDESAARRRRRRSLRSFTISNDLQRPVTIRRNYS